MKHQMSTMFHCIRDHWNHIIADRSHIVVVPLSQEVEDGTFLLIPSFELLLVCLNGAPLISPVANMQGIFSPDVSMNELILIMQVIDAVVEVLCPVKVQVMGVEPLPHVHPLRRSLQVLHVLPVEQAQRVAADLDLISVPEVHKSCREQVFHGSERKFAAIG